jgi:general secretion pathway protein N
MTKRLNDAFNPLSARRRPVSYAWPLGGAALGIILAVLLWAPAQWLTHAVERSTQGQVLLQAPRGTVWSGSAALVLSGGEGSTGATQLPHRLEWVIRPAWLGIRVQLLAPTPLTASINFNERTSAHWTLETPQLNLPAELLTGLGSPWNTLELVGTLVLKTPPNQSLTGMWSASLGIHNIKGIATLDALGMQTALSTVRPLGSYRITLQDSETRLETPQADAPLLLSGRGSLGTSSGNKGTFVGEALAASGKEAALSNLLHIIGQKINSPDGRVRAALRIG